MRECACKSFRNVFRKLKSNNCILLGLISYHTQLWSLPLIIDSVMCYISISSCFIFLLTLIITTPTGNFSTCSLSCFSWWNRFLAWWFAKSYTFTIIRVSFLAQVVFFLCIQIWKFVWCLIGFFGPLQVPKEYYCNLYRYKYFYIHGILSFASFILDAAIHGRFS